MVQSKQLTMKLLALAQHLNIPFIDGIGEYYFGLSKDDYDNYYFDRDGQPKLGLSDWVKEQDSYIDFENSVEVNGDYYTYEGEEYLILNDDEADEKAIEYVEGVIEECYITKEMKDSWLYHYIDIEGAAESAVNQDGRGHHLAGYDGEEREETLPNGETYYLYRTN